MLLTQTCKSTSSSLNRCLCALTRSVQPMIVDISPLVSPHHQLASKHKPFHSWFYGKHEPTICKITFASHYLLPSSVTNFDCNQLYMYWRTVKIQSPFSFYLPNKVVSNSNIFSLTIQRSKLHNLRHVKQKNKANTTMKKTISKLLQYLQSGLPSVYSEAVMLVRVHMCMFELILCSPVMYVDVVKKESHAICIVWY